jgi:hypothetical protein
MKSASNLSLIALASIAILVPFGCSRRDQQTTSEKTSQPSATQTPTAQNPTTQAPATQAPTAQASAPGVAPQGQQSPAPAAAAPETHVAQAPPPPPPPPPKPKTFELPAGKAISVRTTTPLSTKTVKTGDRFEASLTAPLVVNGVVIAPKGAPATGIVASSDPGGRVKGVASLSLQLESVRAADGQTIHLQTAPFVQQARTTKKKDAAKVGIGAGVGAAIGALAGGGKGAAIGAGVGGGAGLATDLATRGAPAELRAETVIKFALANPVSVTELKPGSLYKKKVASEAETTESPADTEPPSPQ